MAGNGDFQNILVVKLRNIGDVLLTSPVFDALKERFPQARISALVNAGTQEMLLGHPAVDQVIVYDRKIKSEVWYRKLARELAFYRKVRGERFDLVLNLTEGDRGALVALAAGARVKVGIEGKGRGMAGKSRIFTRLVPRTLWTGHTVEKNLCCLAPLGVEPRQKRVSFHYSQDDRDKATALLAAGSFAPSGFFHAHVTSRWMFKALPHDKIAFLLDRLSELSGLPVALTCAPEQKERDYLKALLPLLRSPHLDLSGRLSLKELGAVSDAARFFVGVDSAPMHMAAALDVPVLGIFGPTCAPEWGPWDNDAQESPYRNPNGVQRTGKHMVLQGSAPCVPCHRDGCNGSKVSDCLDFSEHALAAAAADFIKQMA